MQRALAPLGRPTMLGLARTSQQQSRPVLLKTRLLATQAKDGVNIVGADQTNTMQKFFHATSIFSLAVTPVALLAPSALAMPLDVVLSVAFPVHAHIGLNWVITDYVPGAGPSGALRMALVGATGLAILGCLKLSFTDVGLVGTLKATWADPEETKNRK